MKTAIIIPYNTQEELTKEVLNAIEETTNKEERYVIVINGYLTKPNPITHTVIDELVTTKNVSYCKTINEGLRKIPGDCTHVLMMGNDSIPNTKGWMGELERTLTKYDLKILSPDYTIGGKEKVTKENEEIWYHNMLPSITYFMTTQTLEEIGLMDEEYIGACYYSDDDYCKRINNKYGEERIGRMKKLQWEHKCSSEGKALGITGQMNINHQIYIKKWG